MLYKLRQALARYFADMRWYNVLLTLFVYACVSWLLLALSGETDLLSLENFFYWMVVTASTVGYGDMSPATEAGKTVVALWVIPVGLSIFALVVGRVAAWVSMQWQRGIKGLKDLHVKQHILVIGWNEQRTLQLINLLLKEREQIDDDPDIVLCVRADIDNPMPGEIEFVRVNSFNKNEDMDRACLRHAKVIIMDNPEDDLTMTTALYCSQRNPDAHAIAYFKDESLVKLLQTHCPNVECTPSVAVEMLAKSAFDPGSSLLHHDLLSVDDSGQAQFSVDIPADVTQISVAALFNDLKKIYGATFIGYARSHSKQNIKLNPDLDKQVQGGDKVFYIARNRITQIDWAAFGQAS